MKSIDEKLSIKLRQIRLLVTDCDGVLTDGGVHYAESGERLTRFHVRDAMGVTRLREWLGIETCMVSGESSPALRAWARKMGLRDSLAALSVRDKRLAVYSLAEMAGYGLEQIGYMGDDVDDLGAMTIAGTVACPQDAFSGVQMTADYVCANRGGEGAFREFAEAILQAQRDVQVMTPSLPIERSYEDEVLPSVRPPRVA